MDANTNTKTIAMQNAMSAGIGVERARDRYNEVRRGDNVQLIAERLDLLNAAIARHDAARLALRNHPSNQLGA